MIVDDVYKKEIFFPFRSQCYSIESAELDSPFDFVLILEINYFFEDGLEKVGIFDHIEDGLVRQEQYSFFTFAMPVELEDVG